MAKHEITIDYDKKCSLCKCGGAANNGLCLQCLNKNLDVIVDARSQGRKVNLSELKPSRKEKI